MQFSAGLYVRLKNYHARSSFYRWPLRIGSERDQLFYFNRKDHHQCTIGKLSIRRVRICNFSRIGRKTEEEEHSKVQKMTLHDERTWSLYCGQVQTGSDRFGQVRTGVKRFFCSTVSWMVSKFGLPPKPACSFLTVPRSKLYDPRKWWKQRFAGLHLAWGVNWCKAQLFFGESTTTESPLESSWLGEFEREISRGLDLRQRKLTITLP